MNEFENGFDLFFLGLKSSREPRRDRDAKVREEPGTTHLSIELSDVIENFRLF